MDWSCCLLDHFISSSSCAISSIFLSLVISPFRPSKATIYSPSTPSRLLHSSSTALHCLISRAHTLHLSSCWSASLRVSFFLESGNGHSRGPEPDRRAGRGGARGGDAAAGRGRRGGREGGGPRAGGDRSRGACSRRGRGG